jgi:transcriptional regulator with XRE-family HTH domain
MEFKDRLKELRNGEGISASSLGKRLGKAESTIRMWEIGKAKPDADTLIKLAECLNCTTDYLLGLSDIKNKESEDFFNMRINNLSKNMDKLSFERRNDFIYLFERLTVSYNVLEKFKELQIAYFATVRLIIYHFAILIAKFNDVYNDTFKTYSLDENDKNNRLLDYLYTFFFSNPQIISVITAFYEIFEKELIKLMPELETMKKNIDERNSL